MTDMPPYLTAKDENKHSDDENERDSDSSSDVDDWDVPLAYDEPRYLEPIKAPERVEHSWRVKEKYKTHCVALVLCLNVGVDPPDVVKTQPCARLECWIDPASLSPSKALESIGHALQSQYERWQPRARYKQSLDPTSDEVKKLCCSLRRNAKDERVLFHYNGHGVPKPTSQGEIWVFNRAYTQYIPLSMYDLQTWMGAPSLYVYDCSNAGVIIDNFKIFADQHEREWERDAAAAAAAAASAAMTGGGGEGGVGAAQPPPPPPPVSYRNCIQLAACAAGQSLPMNPELPADLFTACLTTPVKMAMKWFALRTRTRVAPPHVHELVDKVPGQASDRRTMLGELNWIFTAITDTIAWSSLPSDAFQRLFRADLLTASLCRNFLLADRILRSYNCTPVSWPALPSLARHPLWAAWEHALDLALAQLPALLAAPDRYRPTPFFRDQLQAFQVWLELGGAGPVQRPPPQQLPMVLQVLLSTLHRLRALQLLCRFLALGAWAVRQVLHVGIFPYMLKLLQASAPNLRASMVYIWARIIAVDPSCQVDLVNARGHKYFLAVLGDGSVDASHRELAAFVLAGIVDGYGAGQEAALQGSMISLGLEAAAAEGGGGVWACVALARLWRGYEAARWAGVRDLAHEKLFPLLARREPALRAAAAHALAAFLAAPAAQTSRTDHANAIDHQTAVQLAAALPRDSSPVVRAEILAALQWTVLVFEQHFIAVYLQERGRRSDREGSSGGGATRVDPGQDALAGSRPRTPATHPRHAPLTLPSIGFGSVYMKIWNVLCMMAREPNPQVSQMANDIINYIANQVDSVVVEVRTSASASSSGSSSLPPSPHAHVHLDLPTHQEHHHGRRGKSGLPHTISEDSVSTRERDRDKLAAAAAAAATAPRDRDSLSSNSSHSTKKPIVTTCFVEWAAGAFSRGSLDDPDPESRAAHERAWTRSRNRSIRCGAQTLRGARVARLDTCAWSARLAWPAAALAFHPYSQALAVGARDALAVWEWGSGARLPPGAGWRGRAGSVRWLAGRLLAAASPRGDLAIFRPDRPRALAAWRALPTRRPPAYRPPPAQPLYSLAQLVSDQFSSSSSSDDRLGNNKNKQQDLDGEPDGVGAGVGGCVASSAPGVSLAWCARRHSLAIAGHSAVVRLWDTGSELLAAELPTGTEHAVTDLDRDGSTLVAGFGDGVLRVWDERAGRPVHTVTSPATTTTATGVICLQLRPDLSALVSVCASGHVRVIDVRTWRATHVVHAPGPLAAAAVHPIAGLVACGSENQSVSIYDLKGNPLNTIKFHEGFMAARIGPVSCLAFHPYKLALGVGSKDSTVSVYVAETR